VNRNLFAGSTVDERDVFVVDSLEIAAVEYYFHDSIVILDYREVERGAPSTKWQELRHLHVWEQPHYVDDAIRARRTAYGGRLATHPIGFISGNSKGPDELLNIWPRFQRSYNRNGHGTYPFPGTWRKIGPLQASEQMFGPIVPDLRAGFEMAPPDVSLKEWLAGDHFVTYDEEDITLIPDWERIAQLVLDSPAARHDWSWLLLPIRWGFPVAASPGAGAIKRTDLGHVAASSPAFQPTWNRLAHETGRRIYDPRALRVLLVPLSPWDRLVNGWGLLNVPVALLGILPGWNVALAQAGPWLTLPLEAVGLSPAKTFMPDEQADRFTSLGLGWHVQIGGSHFGRLPEPEDSSFAAFALAADPRPDPTSFQRDASAGFRARVNIHYGTRFSVQNTYVHSRSRMRYSVIDRDSVALGTVQGTLTLQENHGRVPARPDAPVARIHPAVHWRRLGLDLVRRRRRLIRRDSGRVRTRGRLPAHVPALPALVAQHVVWRSRHRAARAARCLDPRSLRLRPAVRVHRPAAPTGPDEAVPAHHRDGDTSRILDSHRAQLVASPHGYV